MPDWDSLSLTLVLTLTLMNLCHQSCSPGQRWRKIGEITHCYAAFLFDQRSIIFNSCCFISMFCQLMFCQSRSLLCLTSGFVSKGFFCTARGIMMGRTMSSSIVCPAQRPNQSAFCSTNIYIVTSNFHCFTFTLFVRK